MYPYAYRINILSSPFAAMRVAAQGAALLLSVLLGSSYAPVPRCSPFIIINKIPESTSLGADFNPYFPVPGDPIIVIVLWAQY